MARPAPFWCPLTSRLTPNVAGNVALEIEKLVRPEGFEPPTLRSEVEPLIAHSLPSGE